MDLYKRVVKLGYLHPEFKNKWVFNLGGFHTVICALGTWDTGLEDAWQEADLYNSATIVRNIF